MILNGTYETMSSWILTILRKGLSKVKEMNLKIYQPINSNYY
jgi:hypothetical protein